MSEEVREIIYTAANLIFIAAVLFIAMLFFDLRSEYANGIVERVVVERKVTEANRYNGFDSVQVTGYEVMNAITAYSDDVPIYVTGAYNYVSKETVMDRLYTTEARMVNPDWFKVSIKQDPIRDVEGLQALYRKETLYFAILVYDSDSPEALLREMQIASPSARQGTSTTQKIFACQPCSLCYNTGSRTIPRMTVNTVPQKLQWLGDLHSAARSADYHGSTVSGILFICIDVPGIPSTTYNLVSVY